MKTKANPQREHARRLIAAIAASEETGFDAKAFVEAVPRRITSVAAVGEWEAAEFLMDVRWAMRQANLTVQQTAAVYDHLALTPEETNEAIADGYDALFEARQALYGDAF